MSNLKEKIENLSSVDSLARKLAATGEISSSLKQAIMEGRVRMIPTTQRVRKSFGPNAVSGEVDLLDTSQDKIIGVSDFNGQKREDGEAFIAVGGSLKYADVAQADVSSADFSSSLPGAVQGAQIKTLSNGNIVTVNSGADHDVSGANTEAGTEVLEYDLPRFYADGKSFKVKLDFEGTTLAAATNGNAFEFTLYGFLTQYK
jgi:hypothetical protein